MFKGNEGTLYCKMFNTEKRSICVNFYVKHKRKQKQNKVLKIQRETDKTIMKKGPGLIILIYKVLENNYINDMNGVSSNQVDPIAKN